MAERITWDQYFMGLALLSAKRSKDARSKNGACIIDSHNRIVGIGYNWFPRGCPDDEFPHARGRDEQGNLIRLYDSKHAYVVHAEANAILNSMGRNMEGATLYCTMPTCNECAKLIIQVWIKRVVYFASPTYENRDEFLAAKRMYASAGVLCEAYTGPVDTLELQYTDSHGRSEKKEDCC